MSLARTAACGSARSMNHALIFGGVQLRLEARDGGFQAVGFDRGSQLGHEAEVLLAELAALLAGDLRAALGPAPRTLVLGVVDIGLNSRSRPRMRDPAQLILRSLQVRAQVLVGLRDDRSLAGRVEAVECRMPERRRQRVGGHDHPHDRGGRCLRPHPVANCGEKEERHERLQTVRRGRCRAVNLSVELGSSQTEPKTPIHSGRNSEQYTRCQNPQYP